MSNKNKIFLFLTVSLILLTISAVSAASDDNSNTTTQDYSTQAVLDASDTQQISATSEVKIDSNTNVEKNEIKSDKKKVQKTSSNNTITKTTNSLKTTKSLKTKDVSVNNYDELKNNITSFTPTDTDKSLNITLNAGTYTITDSITVGNFNLTINGNGQTIDGQGTSKFITVSSGYTLNLNNITIKNTTGAINNSGTLNIDNVTFINNTAATNGAAINATSGSVTNIQNSNFIGNNVTTKDRSYGGGAIYSAGALSVNNTNFTNNTGEYLNTGSKTDKGAAGGAIYLIENTGAVIIANSTFTKNEARYGGAIYIDNRGKTESNVKYEIDNVLFTQNGGLHGAVYVLNTTDVTINNSTFNSNKGFGTYSIGGKSQGGALVIYDSNVTVTDGKFENNTAEQNGGVTYIGGASTVSFNNSTFNNNSATSNGGVAYVMEKSTVTFINGTFENNTANNGGVLYRTAGSSDFCNLTIVNSTFNNNSAKTSYGVIYTQHLDVLTLTGNTFTNNSAKGTYFAYTGAVHVITTDAIIENNVFENNTSKGSGGALSVATELSNNTVSIVNNTFTSNVGAQGGGAYLETSGINVTVSNNVFTNNTATTSGGAMYIRSKNMTEMSNNTFSNNTGRDAGAIEFGYAINNITLTNNTFVNNTGNNTGAIIAKANVTFSIVNCTFENNTGIINGAVSVSKYYKNEPTITVENTTLKNNTGSVSGTIYTTNVEVTTTNIIVADNSPTNDLVNSSTLNSFTYLQALINASSAVTLDRNITFNPETDSAYVNGIIVNKTSSFTVDLGGYTINALGQARIFNIISTKTTTIKNGILVNGSSDYGGAIYVSEKGSLSASTLTFINNTATDKGGAIFANKSTTVTITTDNFTNNTISTANSEKSGGAICSYGGITIRNTNFTGNIGNATSSNGAEGGAIALLNNTANVTITKTKIDSSTARYGGAIIISNYGSTEESKANYTLNNVTITNSSGLHGAVYVLSSNVTIANSTFDKNNATGKLSNGKYANGGALILTYGSNATINNTNFTNNKATSNSGGAVYIETLSNANITDSAFINNTANSGYGGAVYIIDSDASKGNLTISNTTFTNNTAKNGGAISTSTGNNITVTNSSFTSNKATGSTSSMGGAIYSYGNTLILENNTFSNNSAKTRGGSVYTDMIKNETIVNNNTFTNNSGTDGGALFLKGSVTNFTLSNNTFVNNSGTGSGGAAYISVTDLKEINNNTFINNSAKDAGAVYAQEISNLTIVNSTFTNNTATTGVGAVNTAKYQKQDANITIINTTFKDNAGLTIGAIDTGDITANNIDVTYTNNTPSKFISNGSFSYLQYLIDTATTTTITLSNNFTFDPETDQNFVDGVKINKNIKILGNGYTINGLNQARIFNITYNNIQLSSLTLTGAKADNGGAIYSTNKLTLTDVTIENNTADNGGAIYSNSTLILNSVRFTNNTAENGGAIYSKGTVSTNHVTFTNNTATYCGGSIASNNSSGLTLDDTLFLNSTVTATNNAGGGAIYINGSRSTITIKNSNFTNSLANFTDSTGAQGGAIYIENNTRDVKISNTTFTDNKSRYAGAIIAGNYGIAKSGKYTLTNVTFTNNTGLHGAFYILNSNVTIKDSNFNNNSAVGKLSSGLDADGGALIIGYSSNVTINNTNFTNNSAPRWAGAIDIDNTSTTSIANSTFTNNTAIYGGALATRGLLNITNTTFNDNNATHGGAIYLYDTDTKLVNNTFVNNNATSDGGAVYVTSGTFTDNGSKFYNNKAEGDYGGAIYSETDITLENSVFGNNTAAEDGGAIYSDYALTLKNNTFENNSSLGKYGGAIYCYDDMNVEDSIFTNNTVKADDNEVSYGGAVYADGGTLTAKNTTFTNNSAMLGGAIIGFSSVIDVTNSTFINNTATNGGAIFSLSGAKVNNTTFVNNSADIGGVAFVYLGDLTLENSTIVNNSAKTGSVLYSNSGTDVEFNGNTVTNNTVSNDNGKVIFANGDITNTDNTFDKNVLETVMNVTAPTIGGTNSKIIIPIKMQLNSTYDVSIFNGNISVYEDDTLIETFAVSNSTAITKIKARNILRAPVLTATNNAGLIEYNYTYTTDTIGSHTLTFVFTDVDRNYKSATNQITLNVISGNSFTYLQYLINNTESGETLVLDKDYVWNATYDENITMGINITKPITINGNGFTINAMGNSRIFNVTADDVVIANATLTGAYIGDNGDGGAIYNTGSLKLINNTLFNNSADYDGGAIYNNHGTVEITNNTIQNNNVTKNHGGAIYNNQGTMNITGNVIINNRAKSNGGAIFNSRGYMNITNNTIENNKATANGGAIFNNIGTVNVTDNTIRNNSAEMAGAIYSHEGTYTNITGNTISDNVASDKGGAVYLYKTGTTAMVNNTINNNVAKRGAIIYSITGTTINYTNNTASNNKVTDSSSYVMDINGNATIENNTFTNNTDAGNDNLFRSNDNINASNNIYKDNYLETTLNTTNQTVNYDDAVFNVTVNLKDVYNDTAKSGYVSISINGKTYNSVFLVIDGNATITIPNELLNQSNTVTINFIPWNNDYQASTTTMTINATNYTTKLLVTIPSEMTHGQKYTINGTLIDTANEKYLPHQEVTIKTENIETTVETDEYGRFTYEYTANINDKTLNVTYAGLNRLNQTNSTNTLTLNKINTTISITNVETTKVNNTVTITVTLTDVDGTALSSKTVALVINGTSQTITTGTDGKATYSYTPETSGDVTITANYTGETEYNGSTNSSSLTINKLNTTIVIKTDDSIVFNKTTPINITVIDETGNPVVGESITFTIGTTTQTQTTNENGTVIYDYVPSDEQTTITVKYEGNNEYLASTNTSIFSITIGLDGFAYLQYLIDNTAEGGVLTLNRNFTWNAETDSQLTSGIKINKSITINGNGYTINATGKARIFNITANAVLGNATLTEGVADYGGAVYVDGNGKLDVENVSFAYNNATYRGGAIFVQSTASATINNATFKNNTMTTLTGANTNDYGGGAIAAFGALTVNNSVFAGNVATHRNEEPYGDGGAGGAILIINNKKDILIANSTFTQNQARHGYVILFADYTGSTGIKTIDNCIFINNTGLYGAVNTYNDLNVTNTTFTYNVAIGQGSGSRDPAGAGILVVGYNNIDPVLTAENVTFINNTSDGTSGAIGGQVVSSGNMPTIIVKNGTFINNTATMGGAITSQGLLNISESIFENNSATYGGAFYIASGDLIVNNSVFNNNTATSYGGAIAAVSGTDVILNNNTFNNNSASMGGAVYKTRGTFSDNGSKFYNNKAEDDCGGAIYTEIEITLENSVFANNTAESDGGAIYAEGNLNIKNATFENNTSYGDGGAIMGYSEVNIEDSTFTNNSIEDGCGGAIHACDSLTSKNTTFTNNSALAGGAIYGSSVIDIINNTFTNNSALVGGAIYSEVDTTVNNTTFDNNTAERGGLIYVCGNSGLTLENSTIKNNHAHNGSIIYANVDTTIEFNNNTATNNTVTTTNGLVIVANGVINSVNNTYASNLIENNINVTVPTIIGSDHGNTISVNVSLNSTYDFDKFDGIITVYDDDVVIDTIAVENSTIGTILYNYTYNPTTVGSHTLKFVFSNSDNTFRTTQQSVTVNVINGNSFTYLQSLIDNTPEGETLVLDKDYIWNATYDSDITEGINITKPITINGNGYTINATGKSRIFNITADDVVIGNATLTGGSVTGYNEGGAIYNTGSLKLVNNTLFNNSANDWGGAIYIEKGTVEIINNTIHNNTVNNDGGAIYNNHGTVNITGNIIINNTANYNGGAIVNSNGYMNITNNTIENNKATKKGGAIYNNQGTVNVTDNTIRNNSAEIGGAIAVFTGTTNVTGNIINDNVASGTGGAVYTDRKSNIGMDNNTINNNVAKRGAIIYSSTVSNINYTNNMASNNKVTDSSEYVMDVNGNAIIENNTFTNNTNDGNDNLFRSNDNINASGNVYKDNYLETTIGAANQTVKYDDAVFNVTVNLRDVYNYTIDSGYVSIVVNGKELPMTFNVVNGSANITIDKDLLNQTTNNVTIKYTPVNDDYQASSTNITVNATNYTTKLITQIPSSMTTNKTYKINGTLIDTTNNKTLPNQEVTIKTETTTETVTTDEYGMFTYDYTANINDKTLNITYAGSLNRLNQTNSTNTITVNKINTTITIENVESIKINETTQVNITLTDADGNPINGEKITLTIGDTETTITTDSNGKYTYNYKSENADTFTITAKYDGNTYYLNSSSNSSIIVNKLDTNMTISIPENAKVNKTTTINVTLTDENKANIANQEITIKIGDNEYTNTTNDNGIATFEYTPLTEGVFNVTVNYDGNNSYTSIESKDVLVVNKTETKITVDAADKVIVGEATQVNITLVDSDNNPISGGEVTLIIGGETKTVTTDDNGKVTYEYTPQTNRVDTIVALFKETDVYEYSIVVKTVTANKTETKLSIDNIDTMKVGETTLINITLTDSEGNPLTDKEINLTIGNENKIIKTNSTGMANYTFKATNDGLVGIIAQYNGSNVYVYSIATSTLTVEKVNTTITIESPKNMKVNSTAQLNITLIDENNNPLTDTVINLTINDQTVEVTTNDEGVAQYTYTPVSEGVTTIIAQYNGSAIYVQSMNTTTITVNKTGTVLTIDTITSVKVNETGSITVTLTDAGNNVLVGKNVSLIINGIVLTNVTDGEGITSFNYTSATSGVFDVVAVFNGDSAYVNSTANGSLTVDKLATTIVIADVGSVKVGDKTEINITLKEGDNLLGNQTVELNINGSVVKLTTDGNGVARYNYTPLTNGTITVTASYGGNDVYVNSTATGSLTVGKVGTKLVISDIDTVKVNETTVIRVTLTDESGNELSGQVVTITVDGKTYTNTTNADGVVTFDYVSGTATAKDVVATYNGNNMYINSTDSKQVTTNKLSTVLTVVGVESVKINETSTITVSLVDENNVNLVGQSVTIKVNGVELTNVTNSNGVVTFNYTSEDNATYEINAVYDGNDVYVNSTAVGSITVGKLSTSVTVTNDPAVKVNKTSTITVTLVDEDGNTIANQDVTLKINGTSISLKTDDDGIATYDYVANNEGTVNITAVYSGNSTYVSSNATSKITAIKSATKLNISNVESVKVNKTTDVTVTLVDEDDVAINGETITLVVNGQEYTLTTDANGKATQSIIIPSEGVISIMASYDGNDMYLGSANISSLKANKTSTTITIDTITSVKVNQTSTITVKLSDVDGNVLANKNITLTVAGDVLSGVTGSDGIATFTYKPENSGVFDVVAVFNGDNVYVNSTAAGSLTVDKLATTIVIDSASSVKVGDKTEINITLKEGDNLLGNQTVELNINGSVVKLTTDGNGVARYNYTPLTNGTVSIVASYGGNDVYANSSNVASMNVGKVGTKLVISDIDTVKVNETTVIMVTLTDESDNKLSGQVVTITINGKTYTNTTNAEGIVTFDYVSGTATTSDVVATYNGNNMYINATAQNTVTTNKLNTNVVIINDQTSKVGNTTAITIKLTDENGRNLAGESISLTINNDLITVTMNDNGEYVYNYTATTTGVVNIKVSYDGNDVYATSNSTSSITVSKTATKVTIVESETVKINETTQIITSLTDEYGMNIAGETVTITVDGKTYTNTTNSNGIAVFTYESETAGIKEIVVKYDGDDKYINSNTTGNVAINKLNSIVTITNDATSKVGNNTIITIKLADENGNAVSGNVKVTIGDTTQTVAVDSTGIKTIEFTPSSSTTYAIAAVYDGSEIYVGSSDVSSLTALKTATNMTITSDSMVLVNFTSDVEVVLADEFGNKLSGETITLVVDGVMTNVTTGSDGSVVYKYTPLRSGNITIIALYNGSVIYDGSVATTNMVAYKQATTLIITNNGTVKVGEAVDVNVVLTDGATELANQEVIITIDGESRVVTTDSEGRAVLNYLTSKDGSYTILAVFNGNAAYANTSATSSFVVNKVSTTTTIDVVDVVKVGSDVEVDVIVVDENSNPVIGKDVIITVDNSSYVYVTDSDGKVKLLYIPYSAGVIDITAVTTSNDKYINSTANAEITVSKYGTTLTVDAISDVVVNHSTLVGGSLVDEDGSPISNATVKLTVGNTVYTAVTDADGEYDVVVSDISVVGSYDVTVEYAGNDYYSNATGTATMNVVDLTGTTINVTPLNGATGDTVQVNATVRDVDGNVVDTGRVVFSINGTVIGSVDVEDGLASLDVVLTKSYNNTMITATFTDDEYYYHNSTSTSLMNVSLRNATLTLITNNITTKVGQNVTFVAMITDNGKLVNQGYVSFKLNGVTLVDATTGERNRIKVVNGLAKFTYAIPATYNGGYKNITVVYGGSDYGRAEDTGILSINKVNTHMEANIMNSTSDNVATLKVKIFDENNNMLQRNVIISIKVNGITMLKEVTLTNGESDYTLTLPPRATPYNITVVTGENSGYYGSRTTLIYNNPLTSLTTIPQTNTPNTTKTEV